MSRPHRLLPAAFALLLFLLPTADAQVGDTHVTTWQYGKSGAVTLSFDDGTINHFRVARPLLNKRGLPGTFYVVTGAFPGSEEKGRFAGRPAQKIIEETAQTPTNEENFFERASAIRYLGYRNTYKYFMEAGGLYEEGNVQEAYDVIDRGYRNVRQGEHEKKDGSWPYPLSKYTYEVLAVDPGVDLITWEELQSYDGETHEFGSHTITHPYLAVMDEKNIRYELRESREAIREHLGREHTFTAEAPFGTKDERVMKYGFEMYPALRNRMPRPYITEIPRGSDADPDTTSTEYTLWQRGPLSDTPMSAMEGWVDTARSNDNVWLVVVFHGIEGIGWESIPEAKLATYFDYIDARTDDLWVATYADGTKYVEERMNASVQHDVSGGTISVELTHSLNDPRYDLPLTLRTRVPSDWSEARVVQGDSTQTVSVRENEDGLFVQYQARPNAATIEITQP